MNLPESLNPATLPRCNPIHGCEEAIHPTILMRIRQYGKRNRWRVGLQRAACSVQISTLAGALLLIRPLILGRTGLASRLSAKSRT